MSNPLFVFVFLLLLGGQQPAPSEQGKTSPSTPYTERSQKQFSFYPGGKILFEGNVPGNLKVIGWQRATVLLETERIVYQLSPEKAKQLADQYPLQVRYGVSEATIRTSGPLQLDGTMEINATLYVPKEKTDLIIRLIKGDLMIGGMGGWVEATVADGSLEAKSMKGYFSFITRQGDLNIEMAGKRWEGQGLTAATQRGDVTVRLPAEYSAALQLETKDGNITIQYPEQTVEGEKVPWMVITRKKARSLGASVGEGGAPLKLHTAVGQVHVSTAEAP